MRLHPSTVCSLVLLLGLSQAMAVDGAAQTTSELDAYWTEMERIIREGDADAAAALYAEDAVLVSRSRNRTVPIATVFPEWRQEYDNTRSGKTSSVVSFRFSQRLNDETTAQRNNAYELLKVHTVCSPAGRSAYRTPDNSMRSSLPTQ